MMLGGAYGNYSAQQNPIQSSNVYQQDYAQQCYEKKMFLDQVYNRDPSLKLVFQQNLSEPSVFKVRHYFQYILNVDINLSDGIDMTILALSDNGACLNFGAEKWFQETQQQAVGTWVRRIKTLSQVIDVTTPFYIVLARDRDGSYHTLFVLATENISQRQKASPAAIEAMSKILKIDSNYIENLEGDLFLLLLREVYYINGNMVTNPQFT